MLQPHSIHKDPQTNFFGNIHNTNMFLPQRRYVLFLFKILIYDILTSKRVRLRV